MKRTERKKALAGKSAAELQTELEALLKEQFGLRMQVATQQLTNTSKLKDVRRDIARVRTLLQRRRAAAGMPAQAKRSRHEQQTATPTAAPAARKALVQTLTGRVVSDKMDKTVTVLVERRVEAPDLRQGRHQVEQVPRARREQRVQGGDLVEIEATPQALEDQGVARRRAWWRRRKVDLSGSTWRGYCRGSEIPAIITVFPAATPRAFTNARAPRPIPAGCVQFASATGSKTGRRLSIQPVRRYATTLRRRRIKLERTES